MTLLLMTSAVLVPLLALGGTVLPQQHPFRACLKLGDLAWSSRNPARPSAYSCTYRISVSTGNREDATRLAFFAL